MGAYHEFWKRMAVAQAKRYCMKMLELLEDADRYKYCQRNFFEDNPRFEIDEENPVDRYISKVIDLHKEGKLKENLEELERISPFPDGIRGYLREHTNDGADKEFQPFHLMYKLDKMRDEERGITFEILLEYSFLEPEEDCYYGIKAIYDKKISTSEFVDYSVRLSSRWFELISNKKNRKLDDVKLHSDYFPKCYDRMKFTNNADDGTFWIGWVRVDMGAGWSGIKNTINKALNKHYIGSFLNCLKDEPVVEEEGLSELKDNSSEPKAKRQIRELIRMMQQKGKKGKWKIDGEKVDAETFVKTFLERASKLPYTSNGKPLLTHKGDGIYRFNISNCHARFFIQTLFNPDQTLLIIEFKKKYPRRKCKSDLGFVKKFKKLKDNQNLRIQWKIMDGIFQRMNCSPFPPNAGTEHFEYDDPKFQTPDLMEHISKLLNRQKL